MSEAMITPYPVRNIVDSIIEDIEVDEEVLTLFRRILDDEIKRYSSDLMRTHIRLVNIHKAIEIYVLGMPEPSVQLAQQIMSTMESTESLSPPPSSSSSSSHPTVATEEPAFPDLPKVPTHESVAQYARDVSGVIFEQYLAGITKIRKARAIFRCVYRLFTALREEMSNTEELTLEEALGYYKRADDMLTDINHWSLGVQAARREIMASTDDDRTVPRMVKRRIPASAPASPQHPGEVPSPSEIEDIEIDESVVFAHPDIQESSSAPSATAPAPATHEDDTDDEIDTLKTRSYYPVEYAESCRQDFVRLHRSLLDRVTWLFRYDGVLSMSAIRPLFHGSERVQQRKDMYESAYRDETRRWDQACQRMRTAITSIKGKIRGHTVFAITALCRVHRGMADKIIECRQRLSRLKRRKRTGGGRAKSLK